MTPKKNLTSFDIGNYRGTYIGYVMMRVYFYVLLSIGPIHTYSIFCRK